MRSGADTPEAVGLRCATVMMKLCPGDDALLVGAEVTELGAAAPDESKMGHHRDHLPDHMQVRIKPATATIAMAM